MYIDAPFLMHLNIECNTVNLNDIFYMYSSLLLVFSNVLFIIKLKANSDSSLLL